MVWENYENPLCQRNQKSASQGGQNFMKIQVFQKVFHHFGTPGSPRGAQNFNDFHVFHKVLQYFGVPGPPGGPRFSCLCLPNELLVWENNEKTMRNAIKMSPGAPKLPQGLPNNHQNPFLTGAFCIVFSMFFAPTPHETAATSKITK